MGTLSKVLVLSAGVLGGGGLGLYLQEKYYLKKNQEKRDELEKELEMLRAMRRKKEERLKIQKGA